jgi:toxin ParE1/3/4
LGLSLLLDVERATKVIERHPKIGSQYKSTAFRKYVLGRFPHLIFYLELDEAIWIVAIAHSKRKPDYWERRTPGPTDE